MASNTWNVDEKTAFSLPVNRNWPSYWWNCSEILFRNLLKVCPYWLVVYTRVWFMSWCVPRSRRSHVRLIRQQLIIIREGGSHTCVSCISASFELMNTHSIIRSLSFFVSFRSFHERRSNNNGKTDSDDFYWIADWLMAIVWLMDWSIRADRTAMVKRFNVKWNLIK